MVHMIDSKRATSISERAAGEQRAHLYRRMTIPPGGPAASLRTVLPNIDAQAPDAGYHVRD